MRIKAYSLIVFIIVALIILAYKYGQAKSLIDLKNSLINYAPRILAALLVIVLVQILIQLIKPVLFNFLKRVKQKDAVIKLFSLVINVLTVIAALSLLLGSVSSFITSLGLIGLGITWALQTPILCFTGWILINVKGYYRVGDRISVKEIYGDVSEIDFLNTTVWEYGASWFTAEQPSGRLITIPNSFVLETPVFNYTRDFQYVWDEVTVSIAYESDLAYTKNVIIEAANHVLGDSMIEPIRQYREILKKSNLDYRISEEPEIYLTFSDSWVNLHLRYLVDAREKRGTTTALLENIFNEFAKPENKERIKPIYPRGQVQNIDSKGMPLDV